MLGRAVILGRRVRKEKHPKEPRPRKRQEIEHLPYSKTGNDVISRLVDVLLCIFLVDLVKSILILPQPVLGEAV